MVVKQLLSTGFATAAILWSSWVSASLLFDVDSRVTDNTEAGWTAANLDGINGVTFTPVGGVFLDERERDAGNTDGIGGDVANNDMWRDFIFADERGVTVTLPAGMDITIVGLIANTTYRVRLWAFDDVSNGGRNMTWNGVALNLPDSPDPTSLNDQMVSFLAGTDALGTLLLQGRIGTPRGDCCNVFVNGFELTAVPEPATFAVLGLGLAALAAARRRKPHYL